MAALGIFMILVGMWVLLETANLGPLALFMPGQGGGSSLKAETPAGSIEFIDISEESAVGLGTGLILLSFGSWVTRRGVS